MNWISEIFSSTSDQARLATTLIAAAIAIAVVLINQWFTSKRTRNIKLIEKIEEAYLAIIKLEETYESINHDIRTNYDKYRPDTLSNSYKPVRAESSSTETSRFDELHKEFYRVEATAYMLSGLYFQELKNDIETLKKNYHRFYIIFLKSQSLSEYRDGIKNQEVLINESIQTLYKKLSKIMNRHMH